jgi:gas vesicle protein
VDDRARVMLAAVIGAVAGATWGYLYLTESGRRLRTQIEPKLDDFMGELHRMRGTIEKAKHAASESWQSLNDLTGAGERPPFNRGGVSH